MEPAGEKLMEISLDSVLRKAGELEESLRGCKSWVEGVLQSADWGCVTTHNNTAGKKTLLSRAHSHPLPLEGGKTPHVSTELTDQWQRLTAYIVSLEKEVRYYKQLLQDLNQNSNDGGSMLTLGRPVGHYGAVGQPTKDVLLEEEPEDGGLLLVFSYLSVVQLCPVALVCRKWYRVTRHPRLWKEVVLSEIMVQPEVSTRGRGREGGFYRLLCRFC